MGAHEHEFQWMGIGMVAGGMWDNGYRCRVCSLRVQSLPAGARQVDG